MHSQSKPQKTLTSSHNSLHLQQPPPPPPHSKLIPNTRFLVDAFTTTTSSSFFYFLSHFHSDHYSGLSSNWSHGIIYCSATTARLLIQILNIPPSFVVPLPLRQPLDIDGAQVTLLDANHFPGAVQFLFNIPTGERFVHTGDFRFCKSMILEPSLAPFIGADAVFLDTTYCNPKFVFPSQDESIEYIVDVIERVRVQCHDDNVLFLVATYVIGKEKILLELARRFNRKIHVDARKMEVLRVLGYGESGVFTEDGLESNIHVVGWNVLGETWPYFRPNFVRMKEIMSERGYSKVVGFVPTGWTYEVKRNRFVVKSKDSFEIHLVPYSEHSNYEELREYVKFLRPKRVIPTVGLDVEKSDSKHADKMRRYFAGIVDEMAKAEKDVSDDGTLKPGQNIRKEIEPSDMEVHESINCDIDVNLPSFTGEPCTGSPTLLTDEEKDKIIQELSCCLPTWVTRSQLLDLISISGNNVVEAVSYFYERETEFHQQALSCQASVSLSKCCTLTKSDSPSKACLNTNNTPENVDISPIQGSNCLNIKDTPKNVVIFSSQDSKSANLRHTAVPSCVSPAKKKRGSASKPSKKVKVKAKSESSSSKQFTITKFFSKALPKNETPSVTQSDHCGS
ncbi:hypothetical protein Lal_00009269 [Lupinus albus]|uniref:Putative DNA ligase (ATP) n=1 Tax=Lupinus albus TaxID=3870 RepID=A0A6A4P0P7_LUPAL|nr:putative DNA ligase (ATP) [Lupinus albus]KAF1862889.1 hypothetical protein Lal_00009269 [Lupinus albus]